MSVTFPNSRHEVNIFPDECPGCGVGVQPLYCYESFYKDNEDELQVVFKCPRTECGRLFIGRYHLSGYRDGTYYFSEHYILTSVKFTEFPENVVAFSKMFPKIYNQSEVAEKNNLKLICGAGYRKALEFLVKDYLMATFPDKAEEIRGKYLGKAIKMIEDKNIEACASRAVWLGNDETHYTRKWTEKYIEDLKKLIHMVVSWIDLTETSKQYIEAMPSEEAPKKNDQSKD